MCEVRESEGKNEGKGERERGERGEKEGGSKMKSLKRGESGEREASRGLK